MRLALGLCWLFTSLLAHAQLPSPVLQALQAEDVASEQVSIWVQRLDDGKVLLAHQAQVARNPASVMKLLTSYAALDLLGPSFRWNTQWYASNSPQGNTLQGGLWIKAAGDPSMSDADLLDVASQLRQKWGIQDICCELNVDVSAYESKHFNAASFDGKPYRAYNAPAEALMVNGQSVRLALAVQGKNLQTALLPELMEVHKKVDIKLVQDSCGDWKDKLHIQRQNEQLQIQGYYAAECGEKYMDIYWQDGLDLFARTWQSVWHTQTGKATWLPIKVGKLPERAQLLFEHSSKPLAEVILHMNKSSNNVSARAVYLALSRLSDSSQPASEQLAERTIRTWLKAKAWDFTELVLENGAGLSRNERISAEHLGLLLKDAYASAVMPELMASLPVYGMDGTLKTRKESQLYGKAHLKTGSLEQVRAVAGYLLDAKGRRYVVVWIANGERAHKSKAGQEAMLNWVYQQN